MHTISIKLLQERYHGFGGKGRKGKYRIGKCRLKNRKISKRKMQKGKIAKFKKSNKKNKKKEKVEKSNIENEVFFFDNIKEKTNFILLYEKRRWATGTYFLEIYLFIEDFLGFIDGISVSAHPHYLAPPHPHPQ